MIKEKKKWVFGIDVGGTEIKFGLFDEKLMDQWQIPTDRSDSGSHILPAIAESIGCKCKEWGIEAEQLKGIGIGLPGPVLFGKQVNGCVNLGWGEKAFAKELAECVSAVLDTVPEAIPICGANDANLAALGEMWMGGGRNCKDIVMVTLGTGVGGGIVVDGRIFNGSSGCAGEIGHVQCLESEDIVGICGCGNRGCLEQIASASGIVAYTRWQMTKDGTETCLREPLTAKSVFDAAKAGDRFAAAIIDKVTGYLGRGLAAVCAVVNPEKILIGGGVSAAGEYLREKVEAHFRAQAFEFIRETPIGLAELGNQAGIMGAAYLILSE